MEEFTHRARASGTCPAVAREVIFYNVMADGYRAPLTKTQIAELFHAGLLGLNQRCKQVEEAGWRTIDELFPLLRYETPTRRSLYQSTDVHGSKTRNPALAILISILVISAVSLAGYFALRGGSNRSRNSITGPTGFRVLVRAKAATNPPAPVAVNSLPVDKTIVNATALTNLPPPEIYLQPAKPTRDRFDEEKSGGKQRPSSLKTAPTPSKKSARNKTRPEGT
jgi:hypothetical protein